MSEEKSLVRWTRWSATGNCWYATRFYQASLLTLKR